MKVVAAMSGGVDSAVAAALAVEAGHDVLGVHLALLRDSQPQPDLGGCCSVQHSRDARRTAERIGIPFEVWDLSDTFQARVVADFLAEYAAGRTPNPCVRCNQHVKFEALQARAEALGFDAVVTGHWANLHPGEAWEQAPVQLLRARNLKKDQSYVLAAAGPERLARALFPLGGFADKNAVRAAAAARRLGVSDKPESFDICFIADGDTRGFLRAQLGQRPGEIRDWTGRQIGEHQGAYLYTIGQRQGLGLGNPAPDGKPRYVIEVDPESNVVVVGPAARLLVDQISASEACWYLPPPTQPIPVDVQVRAHGRTVPAMIRSVGVGVEIELAEPLRAVAAGQSVVAYRKTRVIAQATVSGAHRAGAI